MCLKKSFFQIVGRSHWWSLYLRMLEESLQLKTTALLVFLLWFVKSLKNFTNVAFFSDLQYGFRSSWSTAELLTVVSDRIARAFNRSGATRAIVPDISKTFGRVWYAVLFPKLKFYGMSGQMFGVISTFLSNIQPSVVLDGKSLQEYLVNAGIPQGSILGPTLPATN